ncbi:MAG: iron ABC transporter permease [Angelakisella sp.]|nr:iron ABC transporter permease [Angelakisella sp.]MCI9528178.1 iron ABC transporter permease [Angelakisella sp.]
MAAIDGKRFSMDGVMTALTVVLLLVVVVIPVVSIIYNAFFFQGHFDPKLFSSQLTDKGNLAAMWNTIKIAFWVTVLGTIVGTFYAWLLGRSDIPAKGLMRALFNIPYMFPPFLGAMAWDLLLNGRSGYLNKLLMEVFGLSSAPVNINTLGGIVFVELSYYFPFVFMQVVSALERMDPTLEECARIAGARQMTVIRKITLPLVVPAISAGALLILTTSLAHFGVPSILGFSQGIYTLPTKIYAVISRAGGSFEGIRQGAALSIMLVIVVFTALVLQKKILSSGSYDIIKGKSMRPTLIKLRGARIPLLILCIATLILIVIVPLVMIFLVSLVKAYGLPLVPENFTLQNYKRIFAASGTIDSVKNSLFVSIAAGIICMFLGTLIAYVVQKIRPKGKEVLEVLSVLPYSLPGTVLAIGVILAWSGNILGISLYNTIWIILVAYIARYLSFSMKSSSAALLQVHPSLEEAARTCGASHMESLTDVTLPLIRPAMVSGFFLIFLPAMREVTTSILLYGPYTRTLGVQIYSLRDAGMIPQAAALGSVAIVIIIICNTIVTQATKDRKGV